MKNVNKKNVNKNKRIKKRIKKRIIQIKTDWEQKYRQKEYFQPILLSHYHHKGLVLNEINPQKEIVMEKLVSFVVKIQVHLKDLQLHLLF